VWLISKALYESLHSSQEQAVESLEESSSDGKPSVQLSGSHTQLAYLPPDKMTAFSRLSRFGMTFKPLTEDLGEELLMSFRAAFPARTSQLQGREMAWTESEAECGNTWRGWLAKYDPDSSLWRTAQCSLLEEEPESLQTLPRSGMTRAGLLWALPMSEHHTNATGSGLWPTPTASSNGPGKDLNNPRGVQQGNALATAVVWAANGKFATPTARDWKSGKASQATMERNSRPLSEQIGGSLNPMWVEWLMGWPLGWTDLEPLEMDKSPCVPQKHGEN
jgi:hypothetical protein